MQGPWDGGYDYHDGKLDRSVSVPPLETPLASIRNMNSNAAGDYPFLGTSADSGTRAERTASGLLLGRSIKARADRGGLADADGSLFSNLDCSGPSHFDRPPPGFRSGNVRARDNRAFPAALDDFDMGGHTDSDFGGASADARSRNSFIGHGIIRSHSAAPSFDGRSMVTPLGLANSETPLVSNRAEDDCDTMYNDSAIDRVRFLQMDQARPSSTGVIGRAQRSSPFVLQSLGLSSRGTAVRPAAKTLMDLIQEDFPESSMPGDMFNAQAQYIDRPRTTSPLSYQARDRYDSAVQEVFVRASGHSMHKPPLGRTADIHPDDGYGGGYENRVRPTPQYVVVEHGRKSGDVGARTHGPPYASDRSTHHHIIASEPPSPHSAHEQPPSYSHQQHVIPTQIVPLGHTVYVNSSAPPPYSYTTVQYHPHPSQPQQHHIIHQQIPPNGAFPAEQYHQYVSLGSVQNGGNVRYTTASPYPMWQETTQPSGGPTSTGNDAPGTHSQSTTSSLEARKSGSNRVSKRNDNHHSHQAGRGRGRNGKGRRSGGGAATSRKTGDTTTSNESSVTRIIEDLRSKKVKNNMTIFDLKGHVVKFCQDQNGSRFIQQRLEVGNEQEKEIVSIEILPAVDHLLNDVFGNYVVQKMFEVGTPRMKSDLYNSLRGEVYQISLQMYGCRVMQKAFDVLEEHMLVELLEELRSNVLSCIHDQNGNHVIQKCVEVIYQKAKKADIEGNTARAARLGSKIEFIIDDVLENMSSLSCHPYGCRVIQRILEHSSEAVRERTLDKINLCNRILLDDQYGNYVIQHVLRFGRETDRDLVLEMIMENGILSLSRQKFASNVVEKLLKFGSTEQRKRLVRNMLQVVDDRTGQISPMGSSGTSIVILLVRDAYANYVVQTTLDVLPDCEEKQQLLAELNSHSTELKHYTFAKHIVNKIT